jgi:hypothetical protein
MAIGVGSDVRDADVVAENDQDVRPPGLAAIYTDHVKAAHAIRKVVLRQTVILNYVNSF